VAKALDVVGGHKRRLLEEGMGKVTFFLGVMNVGLTAFILGHLPAVFWVWQTVKTALLTAVLARRRWRTRTSLYWLDFCWVCNKVFVATGLLALAGALPRVTQHRTLMRALFAIANGPLAWSVALTSNALVFHSIDHVGALFIHLSPPLMSWTFRWHGDEVNRAWPGRFQLDVAGDGSRSFGDLYAPAAAAYGAWWVVYTAWLCVWGVRMPARGWRTVFDDFCQRKGVHKKIERRFGVRSLAGQVASPVPAPLRRPVLAPRRAAWALTAPTCTPRAGVRVHVLPRSSVPAAAGVGVPCLLQL